MCLFPVLFGPGLVLSADYGININAGASLFLVEVVLIGWVQFGQSVATAVVMTVLCTVGILYYQLRVASRWRYLVNFPDPNNVNYNYHSSVQDE